MVIAQGLVLGGNTRCAVVQVTDAQVLAAQRNHRRGAETKAFRAENRSLDNIQPGFHATVRLQADIAAQAVAPQCLLHFGKAQFKG